MGANTWLLWQLADSAFPTGGFAHSGGLEAAGVMRGADDLPSWLRMAIRQAAFAALPILSAAHAQPQRLAELDAWQDALLTNHVANRASRAQGQALLMASEALLRAGGTATFEPTLRATLRARAAPTHLAPVAGVIYHHLGLTRDEARRLHLFTVLRGLVSAAVRLNRVGPLAAQALQAQLAPDLDAALADSDKVAAEDASTIAPILDLHHVHHDRLYSRLFQS